VKGDNNFCEGQA